MIINTHFVHPQSQYCSPCLLKTHLVAQESVVLSECRTIEVFQNLAYVNAKLPFCTHNEYT
jgi:hypothetical protein